MAELQQQLRLYPRGFLGAVLQGDELQMRPGYLENNRGFHSIQVRDLKSRDAYDQPNPQVQLLYTQYIQQSVDSENFDFRRQVLQTALSAFGTPYFNEWFEAQFKNPTAGDLHGRFLVDTLRYIQDGRREMSVQTWSSIVTLESAKGGRIGEMPQYAREFFRIGQPYKRPCKMSDIVQDWCAHPAGFDDLLGSLYVLFGSSGK